MFAALAMALSVLVPVLASADAPSRLVGTIADFHGKYGLVVRDASGRVVDVALHQGTIIKPAGLRLERGMQVTIFGQAAERAFSAAEIDTSYKLPPARVARGLNALDGPNTSAFAPGPTSGDSPRSYEAPVERNETRVP
ncbi:MAG TPA: hypothetical protein VGT98_04420 [Candidatus Elarobacter sp.]|nr:hypothetical protein [Candidatus Elarobacter sp.]